MHAYIKSTEFLNSTRDEDHKNFSTASGRRLDKLFDCISEYWNNICGICGLGASHQGGLFAYFKSCEYTEKVVKENNESFELKLQQLHEEIKNIKATVINVQQQKIMELEQENQELKSLVYSLLDQINSLKENKSFLFEELEVMKISFDDSLRELEEVSLDNLGQQIIVLLDKFNDLKEHNKCLSSRVLDIEYLFEKKEIPDLIDF